MLCKMRRLHAPAQSDPYGGGSITTQTNPVSTVRSRSSHGPISLINPGVSATAPAG